MRNLKLPRIKEKAINKAQKGANSNEEEKVSKAREKGFSQRPPPKSASKNSDAPPQNSKGKGRNNEKSFSKAQEGKPKPKKEKESK